MSTPQKPRQAKRVRVPLFNIICPHCGEAIEHPRHGSQMWSLEDVQGTPLAPCQECAEIVRV